MNQFFIIYKSEQRKAGLVNSSGKHFNLIAEIVAEQIPNGLKLNKINLSTCIITTTL